MAELTLPANVLSPVTGSRVEAIGTIAATKPVVRIAMVVLNVSTVTTKSQGGCLSVATALDAKTEAPGAGGPPQANPAGTVAKSGGMSTGAKIAIAAVAVGGGAGAALALASKKSSTSP